MAIYGSGQKDGFGMEGYAGEISSSASTPWGTQRPWRWARVDWPPDGIAESLARLLPTRDAFRQ
jgi:hypothetical protein